MGLGLPEDIGFQFPDEGVVGVTKSEIGLDTLSDDGIGEGLGGAGPVATVGQDFLGPRQIVLMEGVLDMGEELASLADKMSSASEKIPGRTHPRRIGVGMGRSQPRSRLAVL